MTFIDIGEARFHFRFDGPESAPVVVLSNSLGCEFGMWEPQIAALAAKFRVLRYDSRGHGQSMVTQGPYTIEQLARDVLDLMDVLGVDRAHFCGLSMGGMIGQWLGAFAPHRLVKLVLCNTSARIGTPESWDARIEAVRNGGMAAIVDTVLARWYTADFLAQAKEAVARTRAMLLATPADGYVASCAAVRDMDQRESVARIAAPTLVIAGTFDGSTPPEEGRFLAERIRDARYVELPAAHLSNIETAPAFTRALTEFLAP